MQQPPDWNASITQLREDLRGVKADVKDVERLAWESNAKADQALNALSILEQRMDRRLLRMEEQMAALPRWGISVLVGVTLSLALLVFDLLRTR